MIRPRIGFLVSTYEGPGTLIKSLITAGRLNAIEEDEFVACDPEGWIGLLVSMHADQVFLERHSSWFERFLDGGGRLVFCGHVERPSIHGLAPFVPLVRPRLVDLVVNRLAPHAVFDRWRGEALTFRKGVAGFFGRGHNPPPPGARVINGLGAPLAPVDWEWQRPGGGRLLVHGGNDLWGTFEDEAENAILMEALLNWLAASTQGNHMELAP